MAYKKKKYNSLNSEFGLNLIELLMSLESNKSTFEKNLKQVNEKLLYCQEEEDEIFEKIFSNTEKEKLQKTVEDLMKEKEKLYNDTYVYNKARDKFIA